MDRHSRNYALLGIRPGDSWQKLRDSYKSVVRKWHPDRFPQSNTKHGVAEEKTKEINRAYQELQDYFQQHGHMPLDEEPPATSQTDEAVTAAAPHQPDTKKSADPDTWTSTSRDKHKTNAASRLRFSLVLPVLFLLAYFLLLPKLDELPHADKEAGSSVTMSDAHPEETPQHVKKKYFTTGSSLGEVHSIQGIPTRIEGDTWYYGDAKVVFLNGKVSSWVDSADHNLLALSGQEPPAQETAKKYFFTGSTKIEVRAVQGTPLREMDNVWDYGLSRIYFEKDKVVGWHESPLEPLHIKR